MHRLVLGVCVGVCAAAVAAASAAADSAAVAAGAGSAAVAPSTADGVDSVDDAARVVRRVALADGGTVVVADGDFEARSIGTYSVRLYRDRDLADFQSGTIQRRDGVIDAVRLADLDGSGDEQLVVIVRSVGTGGYLSAQAFSLEDGRVEARSKVADLPKDADPIAAMTKATKSDATLGKGKYHGPTEGVRH